MSGVLFRVEIWAVTGRGTHLVKMLDVGLEQVEDKSQKRRTSDFRAASSPLRAPGLTVNAPKMQQPIRSPQRTCLTCPSW